MLIFKRRKQVKTYKRVGLFFHKNWQLGIMNLSCNLTSSLPSKSPWTDYLPNKTPSLVLFEKDLPLNNILSIGCTFFQMKWNSIQLNERYKYRWRFIFRFSCGSTSGRILNFWTFICGNIKKLSIFFYLTKVKFILVIHIFFFIIFRIMHRGIIIKLIKVRTNSCLLIIFILRGIRGSNSFLRDTFLF